MAHGKIARNEKWTSGFVDQWISPDARLRRGAQTRVSVPHWPSVLAKEWSLAGPNVAQTLLSVPGVAIHLITKSLIH